MVCGGQCQVVGWWKPPQICQVPRLHAMRQKRWTFKVQDGVPSNPVELSPKDVVLRYYKGWNDRDVDKAMLSIAQDCEYEDLVFQDAFIGEDEFREYLEETIANVDADIKFEIDDITDGDSGSVGVLWHCSVNGIEFPFSRGASFYQVENGKIVFGRDVVEPTIKPGHGAIKVLTLVTPIVKVLGPNANPSTLKNLPIASGAMWVFYSMYVGYVLLSTSAPGNPAWQTSPETLQTVLNESINFCYIVPFLNWIGFPLAPELVVNPVDESIFNIIGVWGLMFLPLMLVDKRTTKMAKSLKWGLWTGTWFLTNIFFIPYMALRLRPDRNIPQTSPNLPKWAPAVGLMGFFFGNLSLVWLSIGRPEFGDLTSRAQYAVHALASDRVFFAFCVDALLYSLFQAVLMPDAPAKFRYLPFFGLAGYLLDSAQKDEGI